MIQLQILSKNDLLLVLSYLEHHCANWRRIGLWLRINVSVLEQINEDHKTVYEKMVAMLTSWLRNEVDERRNFKTIATALMRAGARAEAQRIATSQHFLLETDLPFNELLIIYVFINWLLFWINIYYFGTKQPNDKT